VIELPYLAHGPLAEAFAEQTQDFCFLYDRGATAAWVGTRWRIGDPQDLLLKRAVGSYLNGLFSQYPPPKSGSKSDYRRPLLDARFRQSVLEEAKTHLPFLKFAEEFDRDPLLLGVPGNQVIDLRTGALRAMAREDRVTKRAHIVPDPECKAERFQQFLREITCDDADLAGYLMRFAGYVLTGSTKEHALPFWFGSGANGKGTLLNILQYIMGPEYSAVLRMSNLARKDKEDDAQRRVIAKLCGCRLACANEGNSGVKLDMSLLKSLASSDMLSGAFIYEREFQFVPSHKLIIATNARPEVEVDAASRRRVHLVPFDAQFLGPTQNKNLDDELRREAPGIMHLMVQACLEWQATGLAAPERVARATRQLFDELDPMGRFAAECLKEDSGFLTTDELTRAYALFLSDNGFEVFIDERQLIGRLKELPGVKRVTRVGADGARHRGLTGRALTRIDTQHT